MSIFLFTTNRFLVITSLFLPNHFDRPQRLDVCDLRVEATLAVKFLNSFHQ